MHMGKISKMLLNGGKTCWEYANGQKIYVNENKNVLRGLSAPAPGLYTRI